MRRRSFRAVLFLAASAVPVALGIAACSLGLDEAKLGQVVPSAVDAAEAEAVAPADTVDAQRPDDVQQPVDAPAPVGDGGACVTDKDCVSSHPCLRGRCDSETRSCLFNICPTTNRCEVASCTSDSKICGAPRRLPFHAGGFPVKSAPIACGGSLARCFAAVWPFVFVGTQQGLEAYSVGDPSSSSPSPVVVRRLPFLPQQVVASGRRLYVLGQSVGAANSSRLQLAWIDIPSSPFASSMNAESVLLGCSVPAVSSIFPAARGSVFVVDDDATLSLPAAQLTAPLDDEAPINTTASFGVPDGTHFIGASGSRLVGYRVAVASSTPLFGFEKAAGTASAQYVSEQAVAALGPIVGNVTFAQGGDGSLVWGATTVSTAADAGADGNAPAVRVAWLVAGGNSSSFEQRAGVELASYDPLALLGRDPLGPIAAVDATTILALALSQDNLSPPQTDVQVVTQSSTAPQVVAGRRYLLPVSNDLVAVAASGGFAYVLAARADGGGMLHVFAPNCAP